MAECLLLKGGGQTKKLPVLNASYPANVTNWQGEQATFKEEIATPGVPAEYTYQWYRDGAKWTGETNATVSWSGASIGSHSIYCVVTNKAGEVTSRVATLTVKNPNMTYTYSGSHEKIDDGSGNWRIKFKSSGTLKFTNLGKWDGKLDVFYAGGGGAGGNGSAQAKGGSGGGGNGAWNGNQPTSGAANTGGGGGGMYYNLTNVGKGGSGIAVIRNHR